MSVWPQVTYVYDGSFAGFLTCVGESFFQKEYPFYFFLAGEEEYSLYPLRHIDTDEASARSVYAALKTKLSLPVRQLVEESFLTCLTQRERHIYDFIYACVYQGSALDPSDDRALILSNAVRHLYGEVHLLKGFVRFSDYSGLLVAEISPKNRVLPLLRPHFCARYPNEAFLIYDETHKEALCYADGVWRIAPLDSLTLDAPDGKEEEIRQLWKQFYDSIAIKSRLNPKLRMSHMPKRYWKHMTELQ
jgi:probable DNA metabolism protein